MGKNISIGLLFSFVFLNMTHAYVVRTDISGFPKEDAFMLLGLALLIAVFFIFIGHKFNKYRFIDFGFSIIGMALFFIIFGGWQIFF